MEHNEDDAIKKIDKIKDKLEQHLNDYNDNLTQSIEEGFRIDLGAVKFDIPDIDQIRNDIKNSIVGPLQRGINNSLINPLNKTIKDSVNTFVNIINSVIGGIQKAVKGFFDIIMTVVGFINETAARFIQMGQGMNNIFTGLFVTETNGLGEGLRLGFTNIGELLKWGGEFIFSYITCGVHYIQNLQRCVFFYIVDSLGQILYLPIRVLLWFMKSFLYRDMYPIENLLWDYLEKGDQYIFKYTGVHISHYPKNIRDMCYNCKRMKVDALKDKVKQINYDFSHRMPELLQAGVQQMKTGSNEFAGAFSPGFKIPSNFKNPIDPKSIQAPNIPSVNFSVGDVIPKMNINI
jgi:hypothetical protein